MNITFPTDNLIFWAGIILLIFGYLPIFYSIIGKRRQPFHFIKWDFPPLTKAQCKDLKKQGLLVMLIGGVLLLVGVISILRSTNPPIQLTPSPCSVVTADCILPSPTHTPDNETSTATSLPSSPTLTPAPIIPSSTPSGCWGVTKYDDALIFGNGQSRPLPMNTQVSIIRLDGNKYYVMLSNNETGHIHQNLVEPQGNCNF